MPSHAEQLANTVSAIAWDSSGAPELRATLMREYLRRMAFWSEWLESHDRDSGPWPFFDVAEAVDETVEPSPDLVEQVETILRNTSTSSSLEDQTVRWALRFAALRDSDLPLPDIADPYEPLLELYAHGGGFTLMGNGQIELAPGHAISRGSKRDYLVE